MTNEVDAYLTESWYEVVKTRPLGMKVYIVNRVRLFRLTDSGAAYEDRDEMFRFLRLKTAESAAEGLAGGSWTAEGPIMAAFAAGMTAETFRDPDLTQNPQELVETPNGSIHDD